MDDLFMLAEGFRRAIEENRSKDRLLYSFPKGCCTIACSLLQRYLFENGVETDCVVGEYVKNGESDSHEWLEYAERIVIDITGDQYSSRNDALKYLIPVYVGPKDEFHQLFQEKPREPYKEPEPDPFGSDLTVSAKNDILYRTIIESMKRK